jgi:hypothetical protein
MKPEYIGGSSPFTFQLMKNLTIIPHSLRKKVRG